MLRAEGGERAEGVGDAEEGGGVVGDFEVGGTLGDELRWWLVGLEGDGHGVLWGRCDGTYSGGIFVEKHFDGFQ